MEHGIRECLFLFIFFQNRTRELMVGKYFSNISDLINVRMSKVGAGLCL